MVETSFLEERYDIVLAVGLSKIEAHNKIVDKIMDACNSNSTGVSYIVCCSTIVPILSLSDRFERFDNMTIYGPYVAGKVDNVPVVCSPFARKGEFFLCHGDGDKNLPVSSQEDFMARAIQIEGQFREETIAKGIIL